jgi:hypothetical protein
MDWKEDTHQTSKIILSADVKTVLRLMLSVLYRFALQGSRQQFFDAAKPLAAF